MNGVKLIIDDKFIDYNDNMQHALENDNTNISLSHHEKTGFGVSVLDKKTNIIRYYKVVDSELVFESANDVMTGEEL